MAAIGNTEGSECFEIANPLHPKSRIAVILPRYSIRTVLYLAVVVAVVAVVAGEAVGGALWAMGITIAVGSLAVTWGVYVAFYAMVALFARVAGIHGDPQVPAYYPPVRSSRSGTSNNSPAPRDA